MPVWLVVVPVIVALAVAGSYWARKHPSACPYGQRWMVQIPHPFVTRRRLREVMAPLAGERILELGPGTGYYTLEVAGWIGPDGRLEIFDIQQDMLDHTMRAAARQELTNIHPTQGDATKLPYEDDAFDAAFMVTVIGEIPDQDAALRELKRVVKPGGRLVIGELAGDPHMVTVGPLRRRAEAAGLRFERKSGPRLGYFARFSA